MGCAFLYCTGAAKAGTTWLSRALRSHGQASLPPLKETHYFDSLENGTSVWTMDQLIRTRTAVRAELSAASDEKARATKHRRVQEIDRWIGLVAAQRRNDALYEKLMMRAAGPKSRVVADVTPAYALLSEQTYARMAKLNGGDTRFLMILRDPVDRLWSNISMSVTRRTSNGADPTEARKAILNDVLAGPNNPERARSDYAKTLGRLDASVPAQQRMVLFFEDLFQTQTLTRLSEFLGLDTALQGPEEKVNAGGGVAITAEERAKLAAVLRPQYDMVQSRIGALPERWHDTMAHSVVTT